MGFHETRTTLVGRVMTDVQLRRTQNGTSVASFRIGCHERRFDRDTNSWLDGDELYATVTCWRKLADNVAASLSRGDPVIVPGRLFTRGYEVDGQRRTSLELEAFAVGPDLTRCTATPQRNRTDADPAPVTMAEPAVVDAAA